MNTENFKYFMFSNPKNVPVDHVDFSPEGEVIWQFPDFPKLRVLRKVFQGGLSAGVEMFILENDAISISILPTRGMGIWHVDVLSGEETVRVGWKSPVRFPVNPAYVPLEQADGLGWLRGFNELVARCGLESNGAPEFSENGILKYPLHGHIQNTPANELQLEIDPEREEIRLTGYIDEGRLFFNALTLKSVVTIPFSGASFKVDDTIINRSERSAELELLYHVNIGQPVADDGARIEIPFKKQVPRCSWAAKNQKEYMKYHAPVVGEPEMCYFYELSADDAGNTQTFLHNPVGNFGIALAFNKNEFPYFCQWKAQHGAADGYVTGMEPCINFPNTRSFEQKNGRVAVLNSGESRHFGLEFRFATDAQQVQKEIEKVAELQTFSPNPEIRTEPTLEWCE
ncbi:MAG: aldose 1-epimerase family protein [Planctomycetia bacterium]|nr:aldose 1-epimerase family protein [Planctomycetia bacterium]